jgi:RNA polymerase sigma-70 factor (ECF subfamily)
MQSTPSFLMAFFIIQNPQPFPTLFRHRYKAYIHQQQKILSFATNDIIKGCIARDRRSQELLYRQQYTAMIKVCYRYVNNMADAESLYIQAMQKVLENISRFKNETAIGAWIRRIVVNTCIDFCRARVQFNMHPVDSTEDAGPAVEPEVYNKFSAADALQMISELPGNTALVFNLYAIEGYKHDEIATMLGIATGTSKWHLNEARRLLKQQLSKSSPSAIYSNVI